MTKEKEILDALKVWTKMDEDRAVLAILTKRVSANQHSVSAGIDGKPRNLVEGIASVLACSPENIPVIFQGIFGSVLQMAEKGDFKQAHHTIEELSSLTSKLYALERKVQEIKNTNTSVN